MARTLRPHQVEAVESIVRGLDIPPEGVPENGLRAQVNAACGTGKTVMAAHAALRIVRGLGRSGGRVLVLLPTLDLLTQTVAEWRAEGHDGPAVAVCSAGDHPGLWAADVRVTTNPVQLALWHGSGPVTVYATYASLPVLIEAHQGAYGQELERWDLAVVDEAHRTSGSWGKAWAAIHEQERVPCVRRLYLTATPRIWQERPGRGEQQSARQGLLSGEGQAQPAGEERPVGEPAGEGQPAGGVLEQLAGVEGGVRRREALPAELACSMDDEAVFGPVVYELSLADAVSLGLLARYQVVVVEVRDREVTPQRLSGDERHEEEVRGLRLGALQAALLRTCVEHGLAKTITFHHRTLEAEAFATGLPRVARRLHQEEPEVFPERVWSGWLRGEHDAGHRAAVLGEFGRTAQRAVLSNCRVLGEGVDAPAVDAVALLDPKGSPVDIVQAVGRALRQAPGAGKVASLVVPVFLAEGERPEDMATSASYRPLVRVLEGLRAHDERAVEMLAMPQKDSGESASERVGVEPEEGEEESRMLLRFSSRRRPSDVARWVRWNVIDTERTDWVRGFEAARAFREREGHLRVPLGHVEGAYPLGRWVRRQRAAYSGGQLSGRRAGELDELGMVWDPDEAAWRDMLEAARAYYAEYGTLCAPRGAVMWQQPVGQWLANQRRSGALEGFPWRRAALEGVDPGWNPRELGWSVEWQRRYAAVRELLRDEAAAGVAGTGGAGSAGGGESGGSPAHGAGANNAASSGNSSSASGTGGDTGGGSCAGNTSDRTGGPGGSANNATRGGSSPTNGSGSGRSSGGRGGQGCEDHTTGGSGRAGGDAVLDEAHSSSGANSATQGGSSHSDDDGSSGGGGLPAGARAVDWILPGVTVGGEDIGRWLWRQRRRWGQLTVGQRERLAALGVTPLDHNGTAGSGSGAAGNTTASGGSGETDTGGHGSGATGDAAGSGATRGPQAAADSPGGAGAGGQRGGASGGRDGAWERSLQAARQYREREGNLKVPRTHVETVAEGGQEYEVKLGVWLSNQRSRRDKLPAERYAALEELGAW